MWEAKLWSAKYAPKELTVLVVVSASVNGINCLLDLKVAFLINIMKDMVMMMNISMRQKVATALSEFVF